MTEQTKENSFSILNINLTVISLVIGFYILYIWSSFLIPFVIALLLAFVLTSTYSFFKSIFKYSSISFIITFLLYVLISFWIVEIINTNVLSIVDKSAFYQDQLRFIIDKNVAKFWINEGEVYQRVWEYVDLTKVFTSIASILTNMLSYFWIIIFYLVFILLEYKFFAKKLKMMIKNDTKRKKIFDVIHEIKDDVKSYFLIKTFVSLLTWFLSYFVMAFFGLDFALFWAFLIFLLNYIPNIWSVIAVFFPLILTIIQFNDYYHFLVIATWLITIQMIVWNIIDPKLTWNKLNLSPLVILLALVFWWLIWWIIWAVLSVPIMVIISIILSKFEQTKNIAILLSEKWELKSDYDSEFTKQKIKFLQRIKNIFKKSRD